MKLHRLVIITVLCILAGATAWSLSRPAHPKREDVTGVWIGFTQDDLNFYRLTLHQDGSGFCTSSFVENPARLYKVTDWQLKGYEIVLDLQPQDEEAEQIWMKGRTSGWHLNLEVGGKELKWNRKLKLYRELEVLEKIERARARLAATASGSEQKENEPNKAMETTPVDVTISAAQKVAPSTSVSHL